MPATGTPARIALKNILLTTDFSPASTAALPFALAFARLYEAKLFVAHVVPAEAHLMVVTDRLPAQDDRDWREARRNLSEFASREVLDPPCEILLDRGDLGVVIPELIRDHKIDLVVLGTHGRRGVKKIMLGSGAETIYRAATCPVLTVGPRVHSATENAHRIKRILFPVDLSAGTTHALPYALSLAEENEAELVLLHAAPLVPWQHRISVEDSTRAELMRLIPPEAENWCKPVFLVRWEYPAEAIVQAAAESEIDLIVMGVNKARTATLTSHSPWPIASEVVSRSTCPVLTVRG